jgi:hypothetical protein
MVKIQARLAVTMFACAAGIAASGFVASGQQGSKPVPAASEWPTYGHDQRQHR